MGKRGFYIGAGTLIGLGSFLIIFGLVFQLVIFPAILKHTVKKSMVIGTEDNGDLNTFADKWINSKFTVKMQYYIWNYTNAIEMVDRGMKPDAYQVGPYSYRQENKYTYTDTAWKNNSNLFEYIETAYYYFEPESSCKGCDPDKDYVRVPDILFFTVMDILIPTIDPFLELCSTTDECSGLLKLLSVPFFGFKADPIVTVKVSDLLFNTYKSPIITMAEQLMKFLSSIIPIQLPNLDGLAVSLNSNNATTNHTFWYTINTGKSDYNDVGKVVAMRYPDGNTSMSNIPYEWWNGTDYDICPEKDRATQLRGTNGDFFHPFIEKTDILSAYIEDISRSIDFKFYKESSVSDIDTYQFIIDPDAFNYSVPENCGYCQTSYHDLFDYNSTENSQCLPNGILDLYGYESSSGSPAHIVVSLPHFYNSDDIILKWFPRMKPDPEEHQTTLDIEPTIGSVLRANKRLQINIAGGSYLNTVFRQVPNGAFPIAWVNNSYLADDKTIDDIKSDLYTPKKIVKLVCYIGGVGLGTLLLAIGIGALILRNVHEKSKNPSAPISRGDNRNSPPEESFKSNNELNQGSLTRRKPQNWE
ncbi:hypothetical protein FO519_003465 [Halicephalobus sp. NKZ332]|nr:hypothetical protein FO519_003465 [Halicephalobus sp. NKZ332]